MAAIEVQGLTKSFRTYKKGRGIWNSVKGLVRREYETVFAVQDINLKVEEGEFIGFLGPNGAGKTTTLKMLSGLLYPTSGRATVLGHVPWERKDEYRRQFALLLGQKNQLWWDLPAIDSLELNARIYGIPQADFDKIVSNLSSLLHVEHKMDTMVRELSLGERMKMELIAALIHQPKVLFLDEPTIGLDVVSQKTVRDFLRRHNRERKTTIVLTSHYMGDIRELCERVVIIHHGKIFFDGKLEEVLSRFADSKIITIRTEEGVKVDDRTIGDLGFVLENNENHIKLRVKKELVVPACKALLEKIEIKDIDIQEVPIEDIIREIFVR